MSILRVFLFSLSLHCVALFSNQIDYQTLTVFEGEPSANICNTVNALTGNLFVSEEDVFVTGVEPIRIQRCYMSGFASQNSSGWFYPIISRLTYFRVGHRKGFDECGTIHISEKNGTSLTYISQLHKKDGKLRDSDKHSHGYFRLHPSISGIGWTNSGRGEISARSNLKNSHVEMPKKGKTVTYHLGDGTVRHYRRINEKLDTRNFYALEAESLPSGNWILYDYKNGRLSEIKTTNSQKRCYAWARFHYLDNDSSDFNIETSDGKTYCYRRSLSSKNPPLFVLSKVIHAESPDEEVHYHEKKDYRGPLLSMRSFPNGRTLHASYYEHKHNNFFGHQVFLGDLSDRRLNRVKYLSAPVGNDETLIPIQTFFYLPGEPGKSRGHTCVDDAYGNTTVFHYSEALRVDSIEYHQKKGNEKSLHHSEKIEWGAPGTPLAGHLLTRTLLDSSGEAIFSKKLHYDDQGNVKEEHFIGNLTGENNSESSIKRFTYSGDGRNLLSRTEDENGTVTLISYLPGTNLVSAKFIQSNGKTKQRQFFEYDADLICIKEIIDDGCNDSKDDLTCVTERRIKLITPRRSESFDGLPESIEERYFEKGVERLLRKIAFEYSKEGKIKRKDIFDANNSLIYSLNYDYDNKGKLRLETNPIGQTAISTYDDNGNLKVYEDFSGKRKIINTYDFSNRLTQKQEIDEGGSIHTTHRRYDYKSNLICEIDPLGNEKLHEYDAYGNLTKTQLPSTLDEDGTIVTPILKAEYDAAGRKTAVTDARGEATYTTYNARGKPLQILHPDGGIEKFIYKLDGTLKCAIDQEGTTTAYTYDYQGRETSKKILSSSNELLSEEKYEYNAFHLLVKTDPEGNSTRFEYDGGGRKIAEELISPLFHERTEYTYDPLGRVHCIKSCSNDSPSFSITEYDLLDRPIEERIESETQEVLSRTTYEYDDYGNKSVIKRFINGTECPEYFYYDGFGRPIKQIDALGYVTHIDYNEDFINSFGQHVLQKTHTDPNGIKTIYTHDAFGRVVTNEKRNPVNEQIFHEELLYDANGNLCRQISTILSSTAPPRTTTTRWEYGRLNHLISLTESLGTKEEKTTRYTYTLRGQYWHVHKPDGVVLEHIYDPLGRLSSQTSSDGAYHQTFKYDLLGHLIASTDLINHTTTTRICDGGGHIHKETLANNLTISNQFDERGRRIILTLPDSSSIQYSYDSLFLRQVDRNVNDRILYSHHYNKFDQSGHLLQEELIHQLATIDYAINPLGQIQALICPFFSQTIQEYDPIGNILQMSWKTPQIEDSHTYTYDDLSQLTNETGRYTHGFSYDSHFNRLSSDQDEYLINPLNQLLATSQASYGYDPNGNLISKTTSTQEVIYRYDPLDRLIEIEEPQQQLLKFTYDNFHRRLSKTTYAWTGNSWQEKEHLFFIYDGQNEIGATDRSGKIIQLRVLGSTPRAEIGAAIAIELNEQAYAPLHDIHGNIRCLIPLKTRRIAETYLYSAFKEEAILNLSAPIHNPWRFSSKRIDEETGLIYYGRRFYDPQTGRWITPDPQGFSDGPNLYAFVQNDPLIKVDLYGLEVLEDFGPERRWYSSLWDKSYKAVKGSVNFVGKTIFNTFYHAVPVPIVREAGLLVGDMLGGLNYKRVHSGVYHINDHNADPKHSYIYVNGMNATHWDAIKQAEKISGYLNDARVILVYNATSGTSLDGLECGANLAGISTLPERVLTKTFRKEIDRMGGVGNGGQIDLFAFSQGGLISNRALSRLSMDQRKMIRANTFGSASLFNYRKMEIRHYVSSNDLIPWTDTYHRAKAQFGRSKNVIIVPCRGNFLPGSDHNFDSKTYDYKLQTTCFNIVDQRRGN